MAKVEALSIRTQNYNLHKVKETSTNVHTQNMHSTIYMFAWYPRGTIYWTYFAKSFQVFFVLINVDKSTCNAVLVILEV